MAKRLKLCVALLLVPLCLGTSQGLFRLLWYGGGRGQDVSLEWVPLMAGVACWLVVYAFLPRPIWLYVFGHELTHVLWTWAFGGRVKRFKASSKGGHVVVTKTNFMITLAPYFFPLYALVIVAVYGVGSLVWDWRAYHAWFLVMLGMAYAFHLALTWHALKTEQTDITSQGYVFSTVIIWLGNMAVLLLGLPLLLDVPILEVARWCWEGTWDVVRGVGALVGGLGK